MANYVETDYIKKNASILMLATLTSTTMGFIRDVLIAQKIGASMLSDAYVSSSLISSILFGLIGTALYTAFIPLYSDIYRNNTKEDADEFANKLVSCLIFAGLLLIVIGEVFAPQLTHIFLNGFKGQKFLIALKLQRITMPNILFNLLTYISMGILQSTGEFVTTALIGVVSNLIIILYLLFGINYFGVEGLCVVSVLGTFSMMIVQIIALIRKKYKFRFYFDFRSKYIVRMLNLILPVFIGGMAIQINQFIDKMVSSQLPNGNMAALTYATKLTSAFVAICINPFVTVLYPSMSALAAQKDNNGIINIVNKIIGIALTISIPLTISLCLLSKPFIKVLFEHGAFDKKATLITATSLTIYSIGLVAYSTRDFLEKVFYSFQDTKTPMLNGIVTILLNVIMMLLLVKPLGYKGLAVATSFSSILAIIMLIFNLKRRIKYFSIKNIIILFCKILLATLIMGIAIYITDGIYINLIHTNAIWILELLRLIIDFVVGVCVYYFACIYLNVFTMIYIKKEFIKVLKRFIN